MDVDQAVATALANLKGSKDKDLLATARALRFLKEQPGYGSNKKVGERVGVSGEMVREFLALLTFPKEIQHLFASKDLGLEHGRRLWQLRRQRPHALDEASRAIIGMTAMDARNLVEFLLRYPDVSVEDAKSRVLGSRTVKEREFHVIAILPEDDYKRLSSVAKRRRKAVDALVTELVQDWLGQGNH